MVSCLVLSFLGCDEVVDHSSSVMYSRKLYRNKAVKGLDAEIKPKEGSDAYRYSSLSYLHDLLPLNQPNLLRVQSVLNSLMDLFFD